MTSVLKKLSFLVRYGMSRAINAVSYMCRGEFNLLWQRIRSISQEGFVYQKPLPVRRIAILSIKHTISVSRAYSQVLTELGFDVIETEAFRRKINADLWIVFGAQVISSLPPSSQRLIVQLEQTSSSRWFNRRYTRVLKNSLGVIEFSFSNMVGLSEFGIRYPQVFLAPLGMMSLKSINAHEKDIDVLFYGDPYCDRRARFLEILASRFNLKVVSNLFGDEMFQLLARARVVVNIHYYESANLESTRIFECLSLGAKVVSETAPDVSEYGVQLTRLVDFVPVGDIEAMCSAIEVNLSSDDAVSFEAQIAHYKGELNQRLKNNLERILIGVGADFSLRESNQDTVLLSNRVVLTLPETFERYQRACSYLPASIERFEGMRSPRGWIGCGLSYKTLAAKGLAAGLERLWIFEDDVELPQKFDTTLEIIESFLDSINGRWDIFCGLIARFERPPEVLEVISYRGVKFVIIDQMMSMVANAYSGDTLAYLARWDMSLSNPATNTIDQYLNRSTNRIVTTLPFLFGHSTDVGSTLWGIQNSGYVELLGEAERMLEDSVASFESSRCNL
jgi:hypothetical protein